jgi:hypothetical protein
LEPLDDGQGQEEDGDLHDHADATREGVIHVKANARSTVGPTAIPRIFHRLALKYQDDKVDDHPQDGQIPHPAARSLNPRVREYADVQEENGDGDGRKSDVPRYLMEKNRLQAQSCQWLSGNRNR